MTQAGTLGRAGRRAAWAVWAAPVLLLACSGAGDLGHAMRPMPPADGHLNDIQHDSQAYQVARSPLDSATGGEVLRVYRARGKALDYSEGRTAKAVAEAFCAQWGRGLNPQTMGLYEPSGAWAFPGGCA